MLRVGQPLGHHHKGHDQQGIGHIHAEHPAEEDEVGGDHRAKVGLDLLDLGLPRNQVDAQVLHPAPGLMRTFFVNFREFFIFIC